MVSNENTSFHCRICGSHKLSMVHQACDLSNEITLLQIIDRDNSLNQLIRPCECRGEFAHVHRPCLANWIETTQHKFCDVCGFKYNLTFIEKSIFDWFHEDNQALTSLRLAFVAFLVYHVSFLGLVVCQFKAPKGILDIVILTTSYTWIVLTTILVLLHCFQIYVEFTRWRQSNRRVIVNENEKPQLELRPRPKDVLKSSGFKPKDR